ncbi:hypothetical protein BCD48_43355 [Pseudofrankia sp. BMG5.36]|nr:hypothetical protein BCD48_43355 [Pseudofrankia sp. BMG5.36]
MRSRDPQRAEDAFGFLAANAAGHVAELVDAFRMETDRGVRYWLLELIALTESEDTLPLLVEQLSNDDESLRRHAANGLKRLGSKPAREALWRARANGQIR